MGGTPTSSGRSLFDQTLCASEDPEGLRIAAEARVVPWAPAALRHAGGYLIGRGWTSSAVVGPQGLPEHRAPSRTHE
jgi:hypothetical protein